MDCRNHHSDHGSIPDFHCQSCQSWIHFSDEGKCLKEGHILVKRIECFSLQAVSMLLYLGLSIYFILSVYSYYIIIRIQKRSVIQFLDHEFEATEGEPRINMKCVLCNYNFLKAFSIL